MKHWLGGPRTWLRGGLAALVVTLLVLLGQLEWLELGTLNRLYELRGPRAPQTPIVVVSIDDDSFHELNLPWPWPRSLHGRLIELLSEGVASPIIISDSTYQAVKGLFSCRSLGEVLVKGKERPVTIYGVESGGRSRAERVALGSALTITDASTEFRVSVSASLSDLSLTGLRAGDMPRRLDTDRVVEVRFELPGLSRPIIVEGRVMWSTGEQSGIRFLNLDPEDERLIATFLKTRGETLPV